MKTLIPTLFLACLISNPGFAQGGGSGVGTSNPASEHCLNLGGQLESFQSRNGEGYNCVIAEWDLYRIMSKKGLVKPIRCGSENMPCMPNPASYNCVVIGGTLRSVETPEGQDNNCVVEEWALWHVFNARR